MPMNELNRMSRFGLLLFVFHATTALSADGFKAYFGNLDSHTSVSDGKDTPANAYAFARDHGVNFLCLSEHNHMSSQAGLNGVKTTAAAATTPTFVGLVGQEYSTITGGGNHINNHT